LRQQIILLAGAGNLADEVVGMDGTKGKMRAQAAIGQRFGAIGSAPSSARSLKAQSAMEYLMTYGWALLVIAIVLSILVLLNPFSPPAGCRFDQVGFTCNSPAFGSNATDTYIYLNVFNANNNNIRIFTGATRCTADKTSLAPASPTLPAANITIPRQGNYSISKLRCYRSGSTPFGSQASGTDFSGRVWIFYQNEEDGPDYPVRVVSATVAGKITR